jgi:hypothetical protein
MLRAATALTIPTCPRTRRQTALETRAQSRQKSTRDSSRNPSKWYEQIVVECAASTQVPIYALRIDLKAFELQRFWRFEVLALVRPRIKLR